MTLIRKTAGGTEILSGGLSQAQVDKLDGIETAATADQSAAEILAALLTVDGAGSGLDADLLDGQSSAAFATAAQGTLADAAVPETAFPVALGYAISDTTTAITAGTDKLPGQYAPYAFTLTGIRVTLGSACATGTFTVDVNAAGATVLSTKCTVDATETSSLTAVTPAVISTSAIADGDLFAFDVDDAGDGSATAATVWLYGTRSVA